jgi:hypothetical protein
LISDNNSENENSNEKYRFLSDHPQYQTHQIKMQKNKSLIAPNFLPNILPRPDCGDHEYYCCTMLTFLKPWRTGLDLKSQTESWNKTFISYVFTSEQEKIMKHMNIR